MAIFQKNPNEVNYIGGKKHWTDVIKNSSSGDALIWRQPEEDFNTNSTLIVMPGEAAIFVNQGSIEEVFLKSGTYKLTTENYPFISRLHNASSGGVSTFNSVVYFVRTSDSEEMFWGTATPIQVRDPKLNISSRLQARGSYKVRVQEPVKLLTNLVGNNIQFLVPTQLSMYFSSKMMMYIKSYITQFIKQSNAELLGICEYQLELAYIIAPFISESLSPYGLSLVDFTIESLDVPENDPSRQQLEAAFAQSGSMKILGEDWAKMKAAEILDHLAQNTSAGGVASMGAGMGMGMAAGSVFADLANQMFRPLSQSSSFVNIETEKKEMNYFPKEDDLKQENTQNHVDFEERVKKLQILLKLGAVSKEAYDEKMQQIISEI